MPLPQQNKKYTYADYLTWPDEERYEIIEGAPYMQAAPSWEHQAISLELSRQFANYLMDKSCKVFTAPFDLVIPDENKDEKTGVSEYWIVEPEGKFISVFTLQDNMRYGRPETYTEEDVIKVSIFDDLQINLNLVFASI
jgi:Uma2 family endonuclease